MKNSFSLSSQQMQQKLCLCQQVIQYDRSESTESNSWWNFYTYSTYSLEMWRPGSGWSSRHPQHIGKFQAAWKKPLLWTQVTIQSWRAPGAHPELRSHCWVLQKEVNSRAPKQPNQLLGSGDERGISKLHKLHFCLRCSCSSLLKRTHLLGCSASHNAFNPGWMTHLTHLLINCSVSSGTRWQNCYQQGEW